MSHIVTAQSATSEFIYIVKNYLHMAEREQELAVQRFSSMVDFGGSPADNFDYVDKGAYKECYELNEKYIIKFTSNENPTRREINLLKNAADAGIDKVFLPTYYIELPTDTVILPEMTDEARLERTFFTYNSWDDENESWEQDEDDYTVYAEYAIIQPRMLYTAGRYIEYCEDDGTYFENIAEANKNPEFETVDGAALCNVSIFADDTYHDFIFSSRAKFWAKDLGSRLTLDEIHTFVEFVNTYFVHDLHMENIGYIADQETGRPIAVICDWLSK